MYYEERMANEESYLVCKKLEELVFRYKFFASEHDAKVGLVKWGATIRQKFVIDNLPLTAKQEHGGFAQVVSAVQQQSGAFDRMEERIVTMFKRTEDRLEKRLEIIEQKVETLYTRLAARPPVQTPPHASLSGGPQIDPTVVAAAPVTTSLTGTATAAASAAIDLCSPATSPDAPPAQSRRRLTLSNTPEALPAATIDNALRPPREGARTTMTSGGVHGVECFQMHAAPPGKRTCAVWTCRGDKSKASYCYDFFRAMCTDAEFDKLRESDDDGLRRKIVMNLNDLLVAYLHFTYQYSVFDNATQKYIGAIPTSLTKEHYILPLSGIETHHLTLKKINPWNKSTFKDWRSKHEAKDPTVAVILPDEQKSKGGGRKRSR
mmetsp:Transcript_26231/g.43897  ORF Transcript_26231/g.43897 Transcript_26231/m.43897 type:complete len:377 (-) Transcript_26231:140-1270(-)